MFLFILVAIIVLSVAIGTQLRAAPGLRPELPAVPSDLRAAGVLEGFKTSTTSSVEEGASGIYKWGYQPIPDEPTVEPRPEPPGPGPCPGPRPGPCPRCGYNITEIIINEPAGGCHGCDITRHPDINKYVLKSSIPPCPDMSKYVLKSEMCPCVNMNDYIKKSEIPPSGHGSSGSSCANDGRYMLKTDCASYSFTANDDYRTWMKERRREAQDEDNISKKDEERWYEQRAAGSRKDERSGKRSGGREGSLGVKPYNQIGMIV